MIGTIGGSVYKTVGDFKSTRDYFRYMFGGVNGYVYSCGKFYKDGKEHFYNNGVNLASLNSSDFDLSASRFKDIEIRKSYDRYVTLNQFCYIKDADGTPCLARRVENAKRLNALFVDIDCYNVGLSQDEVIYELTHNLWTYRLPQWTFLIRSGKGVYVIWKLRDEDGYIDVQKKRWNAVERYFVERLSSLGADPKASDISRVLRVPFSYNRKNDAMVVIDSFYDISYSLYELCHEYTPEIYNHKKKKSNHVLTENMLFCADKIADSLGVSSPSLSGDFTKVYSFISEHKTMIRKKSVKYSANGKVAPYRAKACADNASDIVALMGLRYGAEEGCREMALFLYRTCLMLATSDAEYALSKTLELNASFSCPLDDALVCSSTLSAERYYMSYNFTRAFLSGALSISEEESMSLSFLPVMGQNSRFKPKNVDGALRKKNNRAYYVRTLEKNGGTLKSDKIAQRRVLISDLFKRGLDAENICSKLSISLATLYREMKVLGLSFSNRVVSSFEPNYKALRKFFYSLFSFSKFKTFTFNKLCVSTVPLFRVLDNYMVLEKSMYLKLIYRCLIDDGFNGEDFCMPPP